mmetsp:Transcript_16574/g.52875  ORF Transcript_16574/g.52875 Transcript_16574/m.52875 type:complete len:86 (-) Transcript_16574:66-323(-)
MPNFAMFMPPPAAASGGEDAPTSNFAPEPIMLPSVVLPGAEPDGEEDGGHGSSGTGGAQERDPSQFVSFMGGGGGDNAAGPGVDL